MGPSGVSTGRLATAVVGLVISTTLVSCGGSQSAKSSDAGRVPAPKIVVNGGRLVDIGGGRSLYLRCVGSGTPTVLLEAGFGGTTNNWSAVQPQLGRTMQTCAYDRAGLGNSAPIPGVHDAGDEVDDLARLLERAELPPPYLLVGHSYGGLLVRLFAKAHPEKTAGVVLVDAMGRNQDRRLSAIWHTAPARVRRTVPDPAEAVIDDVDLRAGAAMDAQVRELPAVPLVVITRGLAEPQEQQFPVHLRRELRRAWLDMQDELAALTDDGVHVVAMRSGHFIQSFAGGQPRVVVRGVRAAAKAARGHTALAACPRIFHRAGARCRSPHGSGPRG
jgi:pimeloyl-ACP methyl ester carboxylesterase